MMIHLLPNSFLNVHIFKDGQGVSIKVLQRILTNTFIIMVVKLLYYTHSEERVWSSIGTINAYVFLMNLKVDFFTFIF